MRRLSLPITIAVFAAAKLVANVGTRFVYAFLPTIGRGLGVSVGSVGWLASARWAVGAVTPATVRLAGREHRRRILVIGLSLFSLGAAVTAACGVFTGALVGFVLMGLGKPMFDTGVQAVTADRVTYATRARTMGILETTWALGFLIGAPIAGWLIQRAGWQAPFWGVAVAGAVLAVPVAMTAGRSEAVPQQRTSRLTLDARAKAFLVAAVLIAASAEIVFITFAAWLEERHGFGLGVLAALATALGVAELAAEGATILLTDRLGKAKAVAAGMSASAVGFVAMAMGSELLGLGLAGLLIGVAGFEFAIVSSISLATEIVPGARVQYLSRMVVAQAVGRAAAAVAGSILYAVFGMGAVGMAAAAIATSAAAVLRTRVRDHEDSDIVRGTA